MNADRPGPATGPGRFACAAVVDGSLTPSQVDQQLAVLSVAVERQWRDELTRRGVDPVARLAVRPGWTEDAKTVSPSLEVLFDGAFAGRIRRWDLSGRTTSTAADDLLTLKHRQLVVLGAAGSGKSILAGLLARDLQRHRGGLGDRVPVVFPAATWLPGTESVAAWLARSLSLDYDIRPLTARQLVDQRRIMPIVDGLDESPDLEEALRQLHAYAQRDTPFAVTSRNRRFREAHDTTGPVALAAVIELLPLKPDAVMAYLDPHRHHRWKKVRQCLAADPRGPIATALASPLMVGLARHRYRHNHPGELTRLGTAEAITTRLLDEFVPLAFDDDVGSTATDQGEKPGRRDTRQRTTPETAERWLTDLAKRLRQRRTTVVAWGELHLTAPHHVPYHTPRRAQGKHLPGTRGLVVGFSVGLPFGAVAALVVNPTVGVLAGLAAGLGGALATGLRSGRVITADGMTPSTAYRLDARNTGRQLLIALAATLTVGLAAWLGTPHLEPFPRLATASGLWVTVLVATVSVFGLRGGPVMAAAESTPATARHLDAQNTRRRLLAALAVVLTAGSMFGLQVGVLVVLEQGSLANGLLYGVLAVLVGSVTLGLSFGLVTWLIAGLLTKSTPRWPDREKIGAVFTDGDVASRAVSWRAARADLLPTAWLRHQLTRYSLSRKGQQPRDVMGFLDEAHRRGVLRQIGAHYQFRHDLLQQHLARDTNRRRGKSPG